MVNDNILSILSFNPNTDFELIACESLIDRAYCEYYEVKSQITNDSLDNALESLFNILDCSDDYVMESSSENNQEMEITLEAAEKNLGAKIKAGWETFKRKCVEFFTKIANALKNFGTRLQAIMVKRKLKDNDKAFTLPEGKLNFMNNLNNVASTIESLGDKGAIIVSTTSNGNTENTFDNKMQELENLINAASNAQEKVQSEGRKRLLNDNIKVVAVDASIVKKWVNSITGIIKAASAKIKVMDRIVMDIDKNRGDTSLERDSLVNGKKLLTLSIEFARKGMSYLIESINVSEKREKEMDKGKEVSNASIK